MDKGRPRGRRLRKPTPERLRRRALAYLERFATTRAHLAEILLRRALPEAETFDVAPDDLRNWVDALVGDLQRLGLIDDRFFAEGRARRLMEKGKPVRHIRSALRDKGVDRSLIDRTLERLGEEAGQIDLQAAIAFARRRRLGPWRTSEMDRPRELAAFGRAGFGYAIADRIVSAETVEDLVG